MSSFDLTVSVLFIFISVMFLLTLILFRKNLLGFSPCSIQSALDLTYAPLSSIFLSSIRLLFKLWS